MSAFQKSLYALLFMMLLSGCGDESSNKKKYLEAYRLFIHEVTMSGRSYSEQQWRSADSKFNLYSNTYFQNLRNKLNEEDIEEVRRLNTRYLSFKKKAKASLYLKKFRHFIEEIERSGEDLDTEEWKQADIEFEEFYYNGFKKHHEQLSKSQSREVISLGTKYTELRIRYGSDNLLDQISDGLDITVDKVKDFIRGLR